MAVKARASKNPDLCQRPHCREPWAYLVTGLDPYFGRRKWTLRVCSAHAEPYLSGEPVDSVGRRITVRAREEGKN
jgi:hypothetical protein